MRRPGAGAHRPRRSPPLWDLDVRIPPGIDQHLRRDEALHLVVAHAEIRNVLAERGIVVNHPQDDLDQRSGNDARRGGLVFHDLFGQEPQNRSGRGVARVPDYAHIVGAQHGLGSQFRAQCANDHENRVGEHRTDSAHLARIAAVVTADLHSPRIAQFLMVVTMRSVEFPTMRSVEFPPASARIVLGMINPAPVCFCFCHVASLSAGVPGWCQDESQDFSGVPASLARPAFAGVSDDALTLNRLRHLRLTDRLQRAGKFEVPQRSRPWSRSSPVSRCWLPW